ncbi:MAG TPA: sigma-E factor negative regulatory protein [Albitalea sp.]
MSNGSEGDASALEDLSALVDGELDPSCVAPACAAWRDDARLRAAWNAYHVIGDVLRSDDLASSPARDAAVLAGVRARLATEPVVLAPEPVSEVPKRRAPLHAAHGARSGRWSWKAPSAVAAGFVLVAGALVATRVPDPAPQPAQVAQAPAAPVVVAGPTLPPVALPSTTLAPAEPFVMRRPPAEGKLIRDARLDRYLAAHQQFAGSSALGMPSGFLRNAATDAPHR